MTEKNPAVFLQGGSHPAEDVRRMFHAQMGGRPGIVGPGDLLVTEKSGTANMSVDVAGGRAFIAGTEGTYQGLYFVENRGVTNLPLAPSSLTQSRKDLVVARVRDSAYSGATDAWELAVITGTPAASPVEPAVPANCLVLAVVDIPVNDQVIANSQITDRRTSQTGQKGAAAALGGVVVCTSTNRPATGLYEGMQIYERDTKTIAVYDGSSWTEWWGAWRGWTPTITQGVNVTHNSAYAKYQMIGKQAHVRMAVTCTSSGTSGTGIVVSLPVAAANAESIGGNFTILDSGVGFFAGTVQASGTSAVLLIAHNSGGAVGFAPSFGLVNGDIIRFTATYEVA